jgi:hypothetical protein
LKRLVILTVCSLFALSARAQTPPQPDPLALLQVFVGQWNGETSGKPGTGTTQREYRFELNDHFLWQQDRSVYQTGNAKSPQFVHEDRGYFHYDSSQQKILWTQFHSEGLVNEYALESAAADHESFEFVTTRIEGLPGFRAKKLYRVLSSDAIDETFWLAAPGKDLKLYTTTHLRRIKPQ